MGVGRERFVARASELARLDEAYRRAATGEGSLTLIVAEAGGGKTRLVDEFVAGSLAPGGVRFAWGRTVEEATTAYRPWRQAFRRLDLPFPAPDAGPAVEAGDRSAWLLEIAERVAATLGRASVERPVVIALDDIHWADEASLHLLRTVAAEVSEMRVMLLGTSRQPEPGSPLEATIGSLTGKPAVSVLRLPALSAADVAEFLGAQNASAGAAAWVHRQSGGNPLYVRELGRLLADEPVPPDFWSNWLPVELRALLAHRLAQLDGSVLDVVAGASVLGDEFDVHLVEQLLGRSVAAEVAAAAGRGVVVFDPGAPGWARFSHGLVRSALYSGLPSGHRVELHRRAARLLDHQGVPDGEDRLAEVALHWVRGASTPDDRREAIDRLRRAAAVVMRRLAFDEGAQLLRSAAATARLGPLSSEERAVLEAELATAEFHAGYVLRAVETARRAVQLAEEARRPEIGAQAALVVSGIGDTNSLPPLLSLKERALRAMPSEPTALRIRLEAQIAHLKADLHSPAEAEAGSRSALAAAEALGDPDALVDALEARHFVVSGPDGLAERQRLAARMVELGEERGRAMAAVWGHLWRIDTAFELGNLVAAHAAAAELARVVERLRRPMAEWHLLIVRAGLAIAAGRLDDAERLAHEARRLGFRLEDFSVVGLTYAMTGEIDRLRGASGEQAERMAVVDRVSYVIAKTDTAYISAVIGDVEPARRLHDEVKPFIAELPVDGRWLPTVCFFAQTACELGDPDGTDACYAALLPYASRCIAGGAGSMGCMGSVSTVLGRLAALLGRSDDARRHFTDAVAVNRRAGLLPYLAETLVHWARLEERADSAAARSLAEEANAIGTRLGLGVVVRRSAGILERLRSPAPGSGPLTRREGEVAALVAEGRSNREIAEHFVLSERTVETHVSRILTKLGLSSRTQLAAWVLARD